MNRLRIALAAIILLLATSTTTFAQQATLLLRSGARISGQFEDIHNNVVYLRVSLADERRIPVDGVAIIDFVDQVRGLPRAEADRATGAGHLLVLRDDDVWTGNMEDVVREGEGGERTIADAKVEVIFRGSDGRNERVETGLIKRIYLGNMPDLASIEGVLEAPPTPTAAAPATSTAFGPNQAGSVPATLSWSPTNIFVRQGDRVTFRASGEITVGPNDLATPDGTKTPRRDSTAPLPNTLVGALIGRVGASAIFGIGTQGVPITMPATGQLLLGVNEGSRNMSDNSGEFRVMVTTQGSSRQ